MITTFVSRRVLRLAGAVGLVGLALALAMQAARVLAPLTAANVSSLEVLAALGAVAVLATPFVVVLSAGLASAIAVHTLASDGARDALRAHGVGSFRATLAAIPAALVLALSALIASAVLEPIVVRLVMARASGLAERAVHEALADGRLLPFGVDGAVSLATRGTSRPTLTIVHGPDARAQVTMLRAVLVALRFPHEASLGPGVVAIRGRDRDVRLSFARARWPLGEAALAGAPNDAARSLIPDTRASRSTLELVSRFAHDSDSAALVASRVLPALLALLACLAPVALGWSWRRPGAVLVLATGVVPAVVSLGIARALSEQRLAALAALVAFFAALVPVLVVAGARRARRARAA